MRLQRYFTPWEVACHNTPADCWLSFLGSVYDVTRLVRDNPGALVAPILAAAGTDVSHWFDADTGEVRTTIDPVTQLPGPYCPQGLFLHVAPVEPTTSYDCSVQVPWWKDVTMRVGRLSGRTRLVRIKNVLTQQEDTLEVPSEETVGQLRQRYMALNAHAHSYVWKALVNQGRAWETVELDLNKTLLENGLPDDAEALEALGLAADEWVPVLLLHYVDDLTVA